LIINSIIEDIGLKYPVSDTFKAAAKVFLSSGGSENQSEAFGLFDKAALEGDLGAHYVVSHLKANGLGTQMDQAAGVGHLKTAADGDIAQAQYDYGICGFLGRNNLEKVQARLSHHWDIYPYFYVVLAPKTIRLPRTQSNWSDGSPVTMEEMSIFNDMLLKAEAQRVRQMQAQYGDNFPPSILMFTHKTAPNRLNNSIRIPDFNVSHLRFLEGFKLKTDLEFMRSYVKKAADSGLPKAASLYGSYLILGENKPKEGLSYIEKAAEGENVEALLSLGYYRASGQHLAQDGVKALGYFTRAADKGDPEGIFSQVGMEQNLYGKPKNIAKSIEALTPMANLGFEQPKMVLGYLKQLQYSGSEKKPKSFH
jgi:TPR repeat protein